MDWDFARYRMSPRYYWPVPDLAWYSSNSNTSESSNLWTSSQF